MLSSKSIQDLLCPILPQGDFASPLTVMLRYALHLQLEGIGTEHHAGADTLKNYPPTMVDWPCMSIYEAHNA